MRGLAKQPTPKEEENSIQICRAYKHTEDVTVSMKWAIGQWSNSTMFKKKENKGKAIIQMIRKIFETAIFIQL